jgi:hypothetical protein
MSFVLGATLRPLIGLANRAMCSAAAAPAWEPSPPPCRSANRAACSAGAPALTLSAPWRPVRCRPPSSRPPTAKVPSLLFAPSIT